MKSKAKTKRKTKPVTVHDMAERRGITINKAVRGGWYVVLTGAPWNGILYCSHDWGKIRSFIKTMPILLSKVAEELADENQVHRSQTD